jgi:hypothetical protein
VIATETVHFWVYQAEKQSAEALNGFCTLLADEN